MKFKNIVRDMALVITPTFLIPVVKINQKGLVIKPGDDKSCSNIEHGGNNSEELSDKNEWLYHI